jgi:tetratricopeptide (TPR) repeat protein
MTKIWLLLALTAELLATSPAYSARYAVDGIVLGARIAPDSPEYRTYSCKPSKEYAESTRCERTPLRDQKLGNKTVFSSFIHTADGTAIYGARTVTTSTLSKQNMEATVRAISLAINQTPANVESSSTQVIATWGEIKLQEVQGDDRDLVLDGKNPHLGALADPLGNPALSAKNYLPVYGLAGGSGYLYLAAVDENGIGHQHLVAVDPPQLAIRQFQLSLKNVLQDQAAGSGQWSSVARVTRKLALATSPEIANSQLDEVFKNLASHKLHSHLWALLPLGVTNHLSKNIYSRTDVYGPNTAYPEIRRSIQRLLAEKPSEPFSEIGYFVVGDFEKALALKPDSVIGDVIRYASGYSILQSIVQDLLTIVSVDLPQEAIPYAKAQLENFEKQSPDASVNDAMRFLNENSERPLGDKVANLGPRVSAAQTFFQAVLNSSSPLADDAAYMMGWLAYHQGKSTEALTNLSLAMASKKVDYAYPALKQSVRVLQQLRPGEQVARIESNQIFAKESPLWYLAARSAYREFDYSLAVNIAKRGLNAANVPVERLPSTTDPEKIDAAFQNINPQLRTDLNVTELPYLMQASREMSQYEQYLKSIETEQPEIFVRRARAVILKYSMLLDLPQTPDGRQVVSELAHKDLRQALHLINMTLQYAPKTPRNVPLREWLHYRKVRVLVVYKPKSVADAIAAMKEEFPKSRLLDDALAEQLFAEGVVLKDVDAAQRTFQNLVRTYPGGNAVDNSYGWMAIILRCQKRVPEAQDLNREIIRRFPMTRHALYARQRLAQPDGCGL